MTARIGRWGNSLGIRLPKMAIETLMLSEEDEVDIVTQGNSIIIRPARLTIEKIFEGFDPETEEFDHYDWGPLDAPMGRERL